MKEKMNEYVEEVVKEKKVPKVVKHTKELMRGWTVLMLERFVKFQGQWMEQEGRKR